MPAALPPLVEELTIARFVGPQALSRGRAYAKAGRVSQLEWRPDRQSVVGTVNGTDPRPYTCQVDLDAYGERSPRIVRTTCSCPIGSSCKHVAAVLIAGNLARAEAERSAPTETAASGWRAAVAAITGETDGDGSGGAERRTRPIALQFELRQRAHRRTDRWRDPREQRAVNSADRIGVRPVLMGARGNWIKGPLTWQNVGYLAAAEGYTEQKARWFGQFASLQSARHLGYVSFGSEWITLDEYDSPLLWAQLADAARIGIPLVGATSGARVEVGEHAIVRLDARSNTAGLALAPQVVIDGAAHAVEQAGVIGVHGLYAFDLASGSIALAPVDRALSTEQRELIRTPRSVSIPEAEVGEFVSGYLPRMRRTIGIGSSDESFEIPPAPPATVVVTAAYGIGDTLDVSWEWELHEPLDPVVEEAVLGIIEATLRSDPAGAAMLTPDGELRASATITDIAAAEFSERVLPAVDALEQVRVQVHGERPEYREMTEAPQLTVKTVETEQNDWFDLGVMVTVEGREIPFRPLFTALAKGAGKLLLVDKTYLSLNQPVFEPLRQLIAEAESLSEWTTGLRISRYQTDLWSEFEDLADVSEAAVSWRTTVDGLRDGAGVEQLDAPAGLLAQLRPYQLDGFRWLAFLHKHRLGGILADDMGLGKTVQTLALIAHAKAQGAAGRGRPFLVVAPTSVVSNWADEAARFTPDLDVELVGTTSGAGGWSLADVVSRVDVVVTTYAILRLDSEAFSRVEWGGLVLDEAQFAKNPSSKVHQAAAGIRADFRVAVTGTPIENNLTELWALLHIVAPGLFPSSRRFAEEYRRPIENDHNVERLARLRRRIRPLMLRRTKEVVATELPPKQEQVLAVELEQKHRRLYDMFLQRERAKILGLVDDLDRNRFIVFRSLTLLRMLALDASLIDPELYAGVPSSKLDALFEQLEDVLAEGHRALVFSQFTSFLQRVADRLDEQGTPYAYLDGSTRRRSEVIKRFRDGESPVFLISLKAGGFGLTLTEADYVFLLDPWWNPASEAQAVDRAHRIGQDKTVMVYRMVAKGTIEEKVMALKERKAELVASVMDDEAMFSEALSAEDIRGLLED
ncbi:MAG: DEAD/DEAH box helicase [Leifsonia sp.]